MLSAICGHCKSVSWLTFCTLSSRIVDLHDILPTGREERGVLKVESIPVAIFTSCQDMRTIAL